MVKVLLTGTHPLMPPTAIEGLQYAAADEIRARSGFLYEVSEFARTSLTR
jgi:hypothetical protein